MVEVGRFVDGLKAAGVGAFAGVSDSLLKSFCAYVTDTCVVKDVTPPLLSRQWGQTLCPTLVQERLKVRAGEKLRRLREGLMEWAVRLRCLSVV